MGMVHLLNKKTHVQMKHNNCARSILFDYLKITKNKHMRYDRMDKFIIIEDTRESLAEALNSISEALTKGSGIGIGLDLTRISSEKRKYEISDKLNSHIINLR
jgi:hypothetical protein